MRACKACDAPLSAWEPSPCGCSTHTPGTLADTMYAIACCIENPMHVRDFTRFAERDYGLQVNQATVNATLAPDPRFCWAGRGLYGVFRHGPLPGPRNLEEATRVVLCATGEPMSHAAVEYALKRAFGYRFTSASLNNAVRASGNIRWHYDTDGFLQVKRTRNSQRQLRNDIPVVPPRRPRDWLELQAHIEQVLTNARNARTRILGAGWTVAGSEWEQQP